jgi:hypothetical protein
MMDETADLERQIAEWRLRNGVAMGGDVMTAPQMVSSFDDTGGSSPGFGSALASDAGLDGIASNENIEARAAQRMQRSGGGRPGTMGVPASGGYGIGGLEQYMAMMRQSGAQFAPNSLRNVGGNY